MSIRITVFLSLCVLLLAPGFLLSYELVLKNGKVIKGTVISETTDLVILKDLSGTQINFKKSAVDLDKTKIANTPPPSTEPAKAVDSRASTKTQIVPETAAPQKKKPARVITEKDLQRLREKYDLGQGLYNSRSNEKSSEAVSKQEEKSGEEWRAEAKEITSRVQQAEEFYNQLRQDCERLKNITVQTHTLHDSDTGRQLPIGETREEICNRADDARSRYDDARADYQEFMQSARQENVPPGYLAVDPEYQDKLDQQQ
jgi:hypothetical protein